MTLTNERRKRERRTIWSIGEVDTARQRSGLRGGIYIATKFITKYMVYSVYLVILIKKRLQILYLVDNQFIKDLKQ